MTPYQKSQTAFKKLQSFQLNLLKVTITNYNFFFIEKIVMASKQLRNKNHQSLPNNIAETCKHNFYKNFLMD